MQRFPFDRGAEGALDVVDSGSAGVKLTLTQAFLANMLGLLRPAVTRAATTLSNEGLVEYRRGEVHIINRSGLVAAALQLLNDFRGRIPRWYRLVPLKPEFRDNFCNVGTLPHRQTKLWKRSSRVPTESVDREQHEEPGTVGPRWPLLSCERERELGDPLDTCVALYA